LKRGGQLRASHQPDEIQFHDRSSICTAALATYLGYSITPTLAAELDRTKRGSISDHRVFFIRNLGFITDTDARRISFEEALRFEKISRSCLPQLRLRTDGNRSRTRADTREQQHIPDP
jgi:predicted ATPase